MESVDESRTRDRVNLPSVPSYVAAIFGLWALAVARPLYDLVGQNQEFLVAHRATGADLLGLALIVSLVLPAAAALSTWIASLAGRTGRALLGGGWITLLAMLLAAHVANRTGLSENVGPGSAMGACALAGAAIAFAHARVAGVRSFLAILAFSAVVVPLVFLLSPSLRGFFATGAESQARGDFGQSETPVVLVVFDQLPLASLLGPDGSIDARFYPTFAGLAREGIWYRNATSVANKTAWAVPAILTGVNPDPERRLPNWSDHPDSIFSWMHPHYSMRVHEPLTELCRSEVCSSTAARLPVRLREEMADLAVIYGHVVLPPAWTDGLPQLTDGWKGFGEGGGDRREAYLEWRETSRNWNFTDRWVARRDADRPAAYRQFIATIGDERQPALYFAHLLLPHEPYEYLPSGRQYRMSARTIGLKANGRWIDDAAVTRESYQRHLLQVQHVDRLLGELIAKLRETGVYDRALVIVTADHGASFLPGGKFKDPTGRNFADILSVPLLVKGPSLPRGVVDERNAQTIDVVPTIADYLGVPASWPMDGISLLDRAPRRPVKEMYPGAASNRLTYDSEAVAAALEAAVGRKLELFGDAGNPMRRADSPVDRLVGRSLEELRTAAEAGPAITVEFPALFAGVRLDSGFVPSMLRGEVERAAGADGASPYAEIAIGLNGTIVATTRARPDPNDDQRLAWSVILPETAFVDGANELLAFTVDDGSEELVLHPGYRAGEATGDRTVEASDNLVLPSARWLLGVEEEGFLSVQRTADGLPYRWTTPSGSLRIPLAPGDPPPVGLELFVRHVNTAGVRLRLSANGCIFNRRRTSMAFRELISFGDCVIEGEELRLDLVVDRLPEGDEELGIAVSSIRLLDAAEWRASGGDGPVER